MKRIIELGTCALVFLLPWQTRLIIDVGKINGVISEYLTLSFYVVDSLLVLLILLVLIYSQKKFVSAEKKSNVKNISAWLLIFFVAWSGLSVFWAENKMLAAQNAIWIILAISLGWLVYRYKEKTELVLFFLISLMLSAWLGIWQFVAQFAIANKWLGLAQHNPVLADTSIVEFFIENGLVRWLRAYGSFDHPNIYGVAMAIGIMLTLWLIVQNLNKKNIKAFLLFALMTFSVGLFVSLSRSAWAGLFLGILVVLIKSFHQKSWKDLNVLVKATLLVVIVFSFMIFLYPAQFFMRSGGEGRLEKRSVNDRVVYFNQGKDVIAEKWLLGVGGKNYIETLKKKNPTNENWTYQPIHNVPMLIWAELGMVGFFSSIILLLLLFKIVWHKAQFELGLIVIILPSLLLDHWIWTLHFGLLCIAFIIGLVLNKDNLKKTL